ncbi:MAG: hypothetical protein KJZ70_16310, partial [Bryobacterales bacterium]|nr:hypothetical protein [Bryobacterales bacterium]
MQGIFLHTRVGRRGRVSPDNARERVKNEKTRTISSFSIVFLRKSANSVAETVQIFGHFPAGKIERREIVVDLKPGQDLRAENPGDDPPGVLPIRAARSRPLATISIAGDPSTRSTIPHFDVRRLPVGATHLPQDELTSPVGYLHSGHRNLGNQSSPKRILDEMRGIRR